MATWPNFFIVGSARAGTTSLYHYLAAHPDIYLPSKKEPMFFCHEEFSGERKWVRRDVVTKEKDYLKLFRDTQHAEAIGEASSHYLSSPSAPSRIREVIPGAKIIILLRHPIERAYSAYFLGVRRSGVNRPFSQIVDQDLNQHRGLRHARGYFESGLYYEQVKRYQEIFGPDQVRVYLFEDLQSDSLGLVKDVCDFLGVGSDGDFLRRTPVYNAYSEPRNGVFRWALSNPVTQYLAMSLLPAKLRTLGQDRILAKRAQKPSMDPKSRQLLCSFYREDVLKLQNLIGRELGAWLD